MLIAAVMVLYVFRQFGKLPDGDDYEGLPYYSDGQFVSPQELVYFPERTTGGRGGFARFFRRSPYAPQDGLPIVSLTKESFPAIPEDFALYWLGHCSAILELEGKRIIVDPVLGNAAPFPGIVKRYEESPLRREDIPDADILLITHDHYDHLEYAAIRALRKRDILFVCPLGFGDGVFPQDASAKWPGTSGWTTKAWR